MHFDGENYFKSSQQEAEPEISLRYSNEALRIGAKMKSLRQTQPKEGVSFSKDNPGLSNNMLSVDVGQDGEVKTMLRKSSLHYRVCSSNLVA